MRISTKLKLLNLCVILTICAGVFVSYELAKGAHLHELNFKHVKYNHIFYDNVLKYRNDEITEISVLENNISLIKKQPEQCLKAIKGFEKLFMKLIGTYDVIMLCEKDIKDADEALNCIDAYKDDRMFKEDMLLVLEETTQHFKANSEAFEPLVIKTVNILLKSLILFSLIAGLLVILLVFLISKAVGNDYKELKKTQKKLASANDELEEFAYRASHDLRSPLISVIGLCDVLEMSVKNDDKKTSLLSINHAKEVLGKLEALIQDILALTETENTEEPYSFFSISDLIDESLQKLTKLPGFEKMDIQKNVMIKHKIRSQKIRWIAIVENLLSNAIKYQDPEKNKPYIRVNVIQTDNIITIKIEDNGLGIPEAQQQKMFKMFNRFHPKTSFGSGLGLYLVKKNVDSLEGQIEYKRTNTGSIFTVRIPETR